MRCPDCDDLDRRRFLKTVTVGGVRLATAAAVPRLGGIVAPHPNLSQKSETLTATLYKSLSTEQKQKVTFPFDHPLRSKVDNNWHITPTSIGELFNPDQQAM